jgi:hypothetical protein
MCDERIARLLPQPAEWSAWLHVADKLQLPHVFARATLLVLKSLLEGRAQAKPKLVALGSLSGPTVMMLTEALLTAVHRSYPSSTPTHIAGNLPDCSSWKAPGDLLQAYFQSV